MESSEILRERDALAKWALPIIEEARREQPAKVGASYFAPGDQISCFWDRARPYAERLDAAVTIFRSIETGALVGFTIKDVSEHVKKLMPNGGIAGFKHKLPDCTLEIELRVVLFRAALKNVPADDRLEWADTYATIYERAGNQTVAIPMAA